MPRHDYPLTTETIKVFNGKAGCIAQEANVAGSYVYAITEGKVTDPFSVFLHYYAAAVRAGCDVSPWLNRLDAIVAKYRPQRQHSVKKAVVAFTKESAEVPASHIEGQTLEQQLLETQQANARGADLERALLYAIAERDREQERVTGRSVRYEAVN